MKATAKAHTNIALIKYWGKSNESLIIPMNNSLSVTLDNFYTTTTVQFDESLTKDVFTLNDQLLLDKQFERVTSFLDLIRSKYSRTNLYARVDSFNNVPTAAGFASSASGFAALSAAAIRALNIDISDEQLSKLTRQGSGSACRSIYGGFVEWEKGVKEDGSDSFAVQIVPQEYWDIRVAAVVLSSKEKSVSSREGMKRTVDTSVFYSNWVDNIGDDLSSIKEGI